MCETCCSGSQQKFCGLRGRQDFSCYCCGKEETGHTAQRGSHQADAAVLCVFFFCFPPVTWSRPIFLSAGPVLGERVSFAGPNGSALRMGTDTTVTLKTLPAKSGDRSQREIRLVRMHPDKQVQTKQQHNYLLILYYP